MKNNIKELLIPVLAVLIALLIGAGIILYLGQSPVEAYGYLFKGAFFGKREIAKTLTEATPMIIPSIVSMALVLLRRIAFHAIFIKFKKFIIVIIKF